MAKYTHRSSDIAQDMFDDHIYILAQEIHRANVEKGFWPGEKMSRYGLAAAVALIQAECSELLEELRELTPRKSSKVLGATAEEEELADVIIRALDYAAARGFAGTIGETIRTKLAYNATRPVTHGKRF